MQGEKTISATLSSSISLFLQVDYLQITKTFIKTLIIDKRHIKDQTLYYSLFHPPLTYEMATLRILLSKLKPLPLLTHLQYFNQKINLTLHSTNVTFNWKNKHSWERNDPNNHRCLEMNRMISNQTHIAYQRIPRCSNNILPSFQQN